MRILFEQHQYDLPLVESIFRDVHGLEDRDLITQRVSLDWVGYFYCPALKDCVFILPKVLLKDEKDVVDGKAVTREVIAGIKHDGEDSQKHYVTPEDIIHPEGQNRWLSQEYRKFIYEFSVWVYRAINMYRIQVPEQTSVYSRHLPNEGRGKRHEAETLLDIILSLIRFNRENENFVMFHVKNMHSGMNKINWTRTVSHSHAMIQGGVPIYLDPSNKRRQINFDEELLVIFFSILNHINKRYGFSTPICAHYELITGSRFDQYLNGMGRKRLRQIKYKYFSDKALQLWDLCSAFFDANMVINVNTAQHDFLLVRSFENVFEAMIDELIGTPHKQIPKGLADQQDGKLVDHMYTDLALTSVNGDSKREVYYIGDSKYYKNGHQLTSESIYKQYTYARNVVQWNVNLFLSDNTALDEDDLQKRRSDKTFMKIKLQDADLTEGYDVIPNFFISGFVYDNRVFDDGVNNIRKHTDKGGKHCTKVQFQFPDRLFDRDTLFLSQYDVNFLYVLYLYARNRSDEKLAWRKDVRKLFREEIRDVIQRDFSIYAMRARLGIDAEFYLKQNFYQLNGRMFRPYGQEREVYYAFAMPNSMEGTEVGQHQLEELRKYFHIEKCNMGSDPHDVLQSQILQEMQTPQIATQQWLTFHYLERYVNTEQNGVLLGYYKNDEQLRWIMGNNDRGKLVYNLRLCTRNEAEPRAGAHTADYYKKQCVQIVILYTDDAEQTGRYRVFFVKDTAQKVSEERMLNTWYPGDVHGNYFFYRFSEEINIGHIRIAELLHDQKLRLLTEQGSYSPGEPMFLKVEDLIKYRE